MNTQRKLKIGLIGLGNIGGLHIDNLKNMANVEIVGVCDIINTKADKYASELNTSAYYNHVDLFDKSGLEAVIIAVPHYDHTPISMDAFDRGIHVLCEKPIAVHVNDAKKTHAAYEKAKEKHPDIIFGIMFQERTYPFHKKLKDILEGGELGKLLRVTWINTAWFRSQAYFNSGGWRATWAGEGGGILTNQCPHNLDLYQWLFGVPARISGHANIGKYHDIEVEDEVSAYFEHDNGMIGHFIVNTIESPGMNRMEIVGENGTLVYEKEKIIFYRNRSSVLKFCRKTPESFGKLENWHTEIPVDASSPQGHKMVTEKFVQAVLNGGGELIAEGTEGIKGLSIGNAIMLSSFNKKMIEMPFDANAYEAELEALKKTSKYKKTVIDHTTVNMANSFSK